MWLADVDVPEGLIDAHRRGELVIFVGAGASIGAPSSLPSFWRLTEEIAVDAGFGPLPDDAALDRVLGEADANPLIDVHRRVADRIGNPRSRPNRLHEAIGALAMSGPAIRVVTTNYDPHLSTVVEAGRPTKYYGPALPTGDDFDGVVYLHGSLHQEPRHLICTDQDFGRAYLRDAWASRFLERMFAKYTVLFIGYSHNDVVMTYLARSLSMRCRRFAFTPAPPADLWHHLGVEPLCYQVVGGNHDVLIDVLAAWARRASMGLLDHRQYVAELLRAAPSGVPDEMSYLEDVLADPAKVGFFTEYARTSEWLAWAARQPAFAALFGPAEADPTLAGWFAEHFMLVEEHTETALTLVHAAGGHPGPALCRAIGQRMAALAGPRPPWLAPWLVLLQQNAPAEDAILLEPALLKSAWPHDRHAALLMFEYLSEPHAVLHGSPLAERPPTFTMTTRSGEPALTEAWRSVFRPHLDDCATDLIRIADGHLRRMHGLLATAGAMRPGSDPLSCGRSAIQECRPDGIRRPIDALVDVARDTLVALLGRPEGLAHLRAWASSDVPLLFRLAIHGWTYRIDVDADAKLGWLRDTGRLLDPQMGHEVFHLLEQAVGTADSTVLDSIVTTVEASTGESETIDYQKFTILSWIATHRADHSSTARAVQRIRAAHPEYRHEEHPGWVVSPDELHLRIGIDPHGALSWIREAWSGALSTITSTITSTVKEYPADGLQLLDSESGDHPEIAGAIVRGWTRAALDGHTAAEIIERLAVRGVSDIARAVAGMLDDATPWCDVLGSLDLAIVVWAALPADTGDGDDAPDKDWMTIAVNNPAGWMTQFWLGVVEARWRENSRPWTGLPQELRDRLETLIDGDDERATMAEIILASRLHFLHSADPDWAVATVLPLLSWTDPSRARRTWDGFLTGGRFNNRLLSDGLLAEYLRTVHHIDLFSEAIRRQLLDHVAAVTVYADSGPATAGWIRQLTLETPPELRTRWFTGIADILADLEPDAVEHQWTRWIRAYWQGRLRDIPVGLSREEAAALTTWTAFLTDSLDEGVQLATQHGAAAD